MIPRGILASKLSQLLSYCRFALAKHSADAEQCWLSLQWASRMNSLLKWGTWLSAKPEQIGKGLGSDFGSLAWSLHIVYSRERHHGSCFSAQVNWGRKGFILIPCSREEDATLPNTHNLLDFSSLTQRALQKHAGRKVVQGMRTRHSKSDFQWAPGAATVLGIAWFGVFPQRSA